MAKFRRRFKKSFRKKKFTSRKKRFFRKKKAFRGKRKARKLVSGKKIVWNCRKTRTAKWSDTFTLRGNLINNPIYPSANSAAGTGLATNGPRFTLFMSGMHALNATPDIIPMTWNLNQPFEVIPGLMSMGENCGLMARLFRLHKTYAAKFTFKIRMTPYSSDTVQKEKEVLVIGCVAPYNAAHNSVAAGAPDNFMRLHLADTLGEVNMGLYRLNNSPNNHMFQIKRKTTKMDDPTWVKLSWFIRFKRIAGKWKSHEEDFIWSVNENVQYSAMTEDQKEDYPVTDPSTSGLMDLTLNEVAQPLRVWITIKDMGGLRQRAVLGEGAAGTIDRNIVTMNGTAPGDQWLASAQIKTYTRSWDRLGSMYWVNRFQAPDYIWGFAAGTSATNWEGN